MRNISTLEMTRYEITARHSDGRTFLIGYTPRKSRMGLLSAMQNRGQAIIAKLAIGPDTSFGQFQTKPLPHVQCEQWTIGFSGRTQRDVRNSGAEHEYVGQS